MKKLAPALGIVALLLMAGCEAPTKPLAEASPDAVSGSAQVMVSSSGSLGRATGGISFEGGEGEGRATFQVHDLGPDPRGDRGRITILGPQGQRVVDVDCVVIDGNEAVFGGETVRVTSPGPGPGSRFVFEVIDNGTPGRNGDTYIASPEMGPNGCPGGVARNPHPVTQGNLVVH